MSALDTQIGGEHYKSMKIQPMEYSMANGLDACQHTAIKYITRFRQKGGIQDLEKAKHCIDMLIEFEQGNTPEEPTFTIIPPGAFAASCAVSCEQVIADGGKMSIHLGVPPTEPASEIDDDSPRQQAIAQNGNDGEHYEEVKHALPAYACDVCGGEEYHSAGCIDQTQLHYVGCPNLTATPEFQAEVDATMGEVFGAGTGGWIEWDGGDCPVDLTAVVEITRRDGKSHVDQAGECRWDWITGDHPWELVKYRPAK